MMDDPQAVLHLDGWSFAIIGKPDAEGRRGWVVVNQQTGHEVAVDSVPPGATPAAIQACIDEARIVTLIDHPQVAAANDLSVTVTGDLWFAHHSGRTLRDAIASRATGTPVHGIDTLETCAELVVRLCQGLQAAHAHGFIHRRVDPTHVLLGHGREAGLIGWSSDSTPSTRPEFISPEVARGAPPGPGHDCYAVGEILFVLLFRRPLLRERPETELWDLRRVGFIDRPTPDEARGVPAPLVAIALKAVAPVAGDRYGSPAALAADLLAWSHGEPVSAHREPFRERMQRGMRRRRAALITGLGAAAALAVGAWAYSGRINDLAAWGRPLIEESFATDGWNERWEVILGGWSVKDGWITTTGTRGNLIWLPERLTGDTAIEYEAMMQPGSPPCDISLIWAPDPAAKGVGWERLGVGLMKCQVGAYDGNYTAILTDGERHLAYSAVKPLPGRVYRIRIEVVEDDIAISIDGRTVCRYRDRFPFHGGHIALYGYYAGKSFRNLRVRSLGLPERPLATAIGDAFAQRGQFTAAAEEYARVAQNHPDTALGREARYKQGLCYERASQSEDADRAWAGGLEPRRDEDARLHCILRRFRAGDRPAACAELATQAKSSTPEYRRRIAETWIQCIQIENQELPGSATSPVLEELLAMRKAWFADNHEQDHEYGGTLARLERYEEILQQVPDQRYLCALALLRTQRQERLEREYPDQRILIAYALMDMGKFDRLDREFPERDPPVERLARRLFDHLEPNAGSADYPDGGYALAFQGRFAEALAAWPGNPLIAWLCDQHTAEPQALLRQYPTRAVGHVLTGDAAACLTDAAVVDPEVAAAWLAVDALARGNRDAAMVHAEQAQRLRKPTGWNPTYDLLMPLVQDQADQGKRVDALIDTWSKDRWGGRQQWWMRGGLLAGTVTDAAFVAQPVNLFAAGELPLLRAVAAERAGKTDQAVADYLAWLALPSWQRGWELSPAVERWARWRSEALIASP